MQMPLAVGSVILLRDEETIRMRDVTVKGIHGETPEICRGRNICNLLVLGGT